VPALAAALVLAIALGAPAAALAQSRVRAALDLAAPSDCIPADELRGAVAAILERPVLERAAEADVVVRASIERAAGAGWSIHLELVARDGRVIGRRHAERDGGSCRSIDRMIAVIIAMVVDIPELEASLSLPAEPAPQAPGDQEAPPALEAPRPERGGEARSPSFELRSAIGGALSVGLVPGVGLGVDVALLLTPGPGWPALIFEARMLAPSEQHDELGRGASFTAIDAHIGACPELELGIARIGGCAEIGGGALIVTPVALDAGPASVVSPMLGVRALATGSLLPRPVEIRLAIGVEIPLIRERFVRDRGTPAQTTIHEPAPVALVTGLQIGVVAEP
jgi:hypothetical protein